MLGQQCWDMLRRDVAIVWPGLKGNLVKKGKKIVDLLP